MTMYDARGRVSRPEGHMQRALRSVRALLGGTLAASIAACAGSEGDTTLTFSEGPAQHTPEAQHPGGAPFESEESVEKGKVLTARELKTLPGGIVLRPHLYARQKACTSSSQCPVWSTGCSAGTCAGTLQFWRPVVTGNVYFVVASGAAFIKPALDAALADIRNAADDCLGTNLVSATMSDWNALGQGQASTPAVFIHHGDVRTVCKQKDEQGQEIPILPGREPRGCAAFPRLSPLLFGINHMVPGPYIGLDAAQLTANDDTTRAILTHEILHTLGVAHSAQSDEDAPWALIPGTARGGVLSIMQSYGGSDFSFTLSAEDKDVIDTLYSAQPGSSCYPGGFEDIEPICSNSCTKISLTSVAGQCCWCNGNYGSYVRSGWSAITYLCQ